MSADEAKPSRGFPTGMVIGTAAATFLFASKGVAAIVNQWISVPFVTDPVTAAAQPILYWSVVTGILVLAALGAYALITAILDWRRARKEG